MSRTFRNVHPRITDSRVKFYLSHGLAEWFTKHGTNGWLFESIRGQNGRRLFKRKRSRRTRRQEQTCLKKQCLSLLSNH
jgi:hypothetical protein